MKKKNAYTFLTKKAAFYAGLDSKQKTFGNYQATYQKELCLLFENQQFFHRMKVERLDPTPCLF